MAQFQLPMILEPLECHDSEDCFHCLQPGSRKGLDTLEGLVRLLMKHQLGVIAYFGRFRLEDYLRSQYLSPGSQHLYNRRALALDHQLMGNFPDTTIERSHFCLLLASELDFDY